MHKLFKMFSLLFLLFMAYQAPSAFAAQNSDIPFEVSPVIPDNQTDPLAGYFDLNVTPNYQQTIYIAVKNLQAHPITVNVTPFNAITSSNGDIVYDVNAKKTAYSHLKVYLNKYITNEKKVEIPANTTIKIPLKINLPSINKGMVLGGIHVIAEDAALNQQNVKKGTATFQIKNQIAYVIGMKMQFPVTVPPEFSFGNASVDMQYGTPKLFIEMKNSAPAVIKDLSGTYNVYDKNGNKILYGSFANMKMAPNTRFAYPINWVSGKILPGTYTVKLSANAAGKVITAERKFTIKEDKAIRQYNNTRKEVHSNTSLPWWNYLVIIAVVGVIFFIIGRKSKKDDHN